MSTFVNYPPMPRKSTNPILHRCPPPTSFKFTDDPNWRIFRILSEFVAGFEFLADLRREVSFFGSARFKPSHRYYKMAEELAYRLGKSGFTIVTGGGPGIMEAANKGAKRAGAPSIGLNIELPNEQRTNPYVEKGMGFNYFFTRKTMLSASAQAYIFFPGGFGTLDEMTELVTLIQTKKMSRVPIILVGKKYWEPFLQWVEATLLGELKAIEESDTGLYELVDSADEAFTIISRSKERQYF